MKSDVKRFYCKVDMLAELKKAGYSQLKLREQGLLWPTEITRLRSGDLPSWGLLEKVCNLTGKTLFDVIGDNGAAADAQHADDDDDVLLDDFTDGEVMRLMSWARMEADTPIRPIEEYRYEDTDKNRAFWLYDVMLRNAKHQIAAMIEKYAAMRGIGGDNHCMTSTNSNSR